MDSFLLIVNQGSNLGDLTNGYGYVSERTERGCSLARLQGGLQHIRVLLLSLNSCVPRDGSCRPTALKRLTTNKL